MYDLIIQLNHKMSQKHAEYDLLLKQVNERKDGDIIDISVISTTINNMSITLSKQDSLEHNRLIGSLIVHHNNIKNNTYVANPFGGTIMAKGVGLINIMTNLDPILQQIIGQYIENNRK